MARVLDLALLLVGVLALLASIIDHGDRQWRLALHAPVTPYQPTARTHTDAGETELPVIPRPFLSDLNGDGVNELILISGLSTLLVYSHQSSVANDKNLSRPPLSKKAAPVLSVGGDEYTLVYDFDTAGNQRPVLAGLHRIISVSSGFVDRYSDNSDRQQVIVIVNAALQVWCIDTATRSVLWRQSLMPDPDIDSDADTDVGASTAGDNIGSSEAFIRSVTDHTVTEVSVLINPHPMRINDTGVVVIGIRLVPLSTSDTNTNTSTLTNSDDSEDNGHFSFYAINGRSGQIRWTHESEHRHTRNQLHNDVSRVLHGQHEVHSGEVEWRNFRQAVVANLPHAWYTQSDTKLTLAHLDKPRAASKAPNTNTKTVSPLSSTSTARSAFYVSLTARRAHDSVEHIESPNVIVAHTSEGIEFIHFYTGRALTHLNLDSGVAHVDLNGDGVIDHVSLYESDQSSLAHHSHDSNTVTGTLANSHCDLVASSGIPPTHHLFNASVCTVSWMTTNTPFGWLTGSNLVTERVRARRTVSANASGLTGRRHNGGRGRSSVDLIEVMSDATFIQIDNIDTDSDNEPMAAAMSVAMPVASGPLVLPSPITDRSLIHSTRKYISYSLSSQGWLTGINSDGQRVVNIRTQATFPTDAVNDRRLGLRLRHYPLYVHTEDGMRDCLLLIGSQSLVIVDRTDSSTLDTIKLRDSVSAIDSVSVSDISVGDLNGDYYNDLLLVTNKGVLAYTVAAHVSSAFFTRAIAMLAAAILVALVVKVSRVSKPTMQKYVVAMAKSLGVGIEASQRYMPKVHRNKEASPRESQSLLHSSSSSSSMGSELAHRHVASFQP